MAHIVIVDTELVGHECAWPIFAALASRSLRGCECRRATPTGHHPIKTDGIAGQSLQNVCVWPSRTPHDVLWLASRTPFGQPGETA